MRRIECCSNNALYELLVTKNNMPNSFKKLALSDVEFENLFFDIQSMQYVCKKEDQYWSLKRIGDRYSLDRALDEISEQVTRPLISKEAFKNEIERRHKTSFIKKRTKSVVHEYVDDQRKVLVNRNRLAVGHQLIDLSNRICSCIIFDRYAYASIYDKSNSAVQHIACCDIESCRIEWILEIHRVAELWFQKVYE